MISSRYARNLWVLLQVTAMISNIIKITMATEQPNCKCLYNVLKNGTRRNYNTYDCVARETPNSSLKFI